MTDGPIVCNAGPLMCRQDQGKAIDQIRAQEAKDLKAKGREPVLTKTR